MKSQEQADISQTVKNITIGTIKIATVGLAGYLMCEAGPEISEYTKQLSAEIAIKNYTNTIIAIIEAGALTIAAKSAAEVVVDGLYQITHPKKYDSRPVKEK